MSTFDKIIEILKDAPDKAMDIKDLSKKTGISQDGICEAVRDNKKLLQLVPWDNFEKLYVVLGD